MSETINIITDDFQTSAHKVAPQSGLQWKWKLFSMDGVTDMPKSGEPCKNVKQWATVGASLWESRNKLPQKWSLNLGACGMIIQMLKQILASMHYVHPSFVKQLNNNNRHARFSYVVNTISKHHVPFSDECAVYQRPWSRSIYFCSNKTKFPPRTWTLFALCYDMDISVSYTHFWSIWLKES